MRKSCSTKNTFAKAPTPPVGASLLAMRPSQSTSMLNVSPPSRAGSLPQGTVVTLSKCCG
ncbi:hypothetical protein ELZ14_24320 [Pseudomonas brassicacearum]|nr:hypothetical protein ELZ14_24320 [Pseudomonas brassicacearum]